MMSSLCERAADASRVRTDYARARVAFVVIAGLTRNPGCLPVTPFGAPIASADQHRVEQRATRSRSHEVDHVRDRLRSALGFSSEFRRNVHLDGAAFRAKHFKSLRKPIAVWAILGSSRQVQRAAMQALKCLKNRTITLHEKSFSDVYPEIRIDPK
jgi:hypothetical protein